MQQFSWRIVILLALFLTVSRAQDFVCPDVPPPCEEDFYPDPLGDCSVYYQCDANCIAYYFECPSDLHFDPNQDICVSPEEYPCTDADIVQPSAFQAWSTIGSATPQNPIEFDEELDRVDGFNIDSSIFTAPTSGIYFFSMTTGFLSRSGVTTFLNTPYPWIERVDLTRTSTAHTDVDTTSRDVIIELNANDLLTMAAIDGGFFSTASGAETAFAGFSLHDTMNPVAAPAFSVSRTDGFSSTGGTITYNFEISNRNRMINLNTGIFTTERAGNYYLSFSIGVENDFNSDLVAVQLMVDGEPKAELTRQHGNYSGVDTLSRSLMLQLNDSQEVTLQLDSGEIYSDANHLICFNAFLYNPVSPDVLNPMNATAWSAQRSTSFTAVDDSPLTFDITEVSEGDAYNETTGEVTVLMSGYYYVSINAAAAAGEPVAMHVVVNDVIQASLTRSSTSHTGVDSLARSAIVYMDEGDVMRVDVGAGTTVYSDALLYTSFSGFMIVNR